MLLVAGLGNPGPKYEKNRHNIGFMAVDSVHSRYNLSPWRKRFQSEVSEGNLFGEKSLLLKPQTFMNESGRAIAEAASFYKINAKDILVFHDELDLAPGKIRIKTGGGHGGHNGLRSIHAHIGDAYRRVRMGIGHPGHKEKVAGYVLHDFSKSEFEWLDPLIDEITREFETLLKGEDSTFMNKVALALKPLPAEKNSKSTLEKSRASNQNEKIEKKVSANPFQALGKLFKEDK